MINDIPDFMLLRGDIEDVILHAVDSDGKVPKQSDKNPPHLLKFHHNLVNLDFYGGVGYIDKNGESKRVKALKRLFDRQQGTSFVLLLTLNVRDKLDEELKGYLLNSRERLAPDLLEVVSWYASDQPKIKECRLKAVIPLFIQSEAESRMFQCHAYPPVAYGTKSRMVHFSFRLTHTPGNLRAFSSQGIAQLLNLPLLCVRDGKLKVGQQHPGYDYDRLSPSIEFLPAETQQSILLDTTMGKEI